jgi:hypothetical protein
MKLPRMFCEESGKPSIKRINGSGLIYTGVAGKIGLWYYSLNHAVANFERIDSSCEYLIAAGIAILAGSVIEKHEKFR